MTGRNNSTNGLKFAKVRYIDFTNGSDVYGDGTQGYPWQSIQYAYNSITPSFNDPYTFYLAGQYDTADTTTITGKPNVNLVGIGNQPIIPFAITITSPSVNDVVYFVNLNITGNVTWIRNDVYAISFYWINTVCSGVLDFEQQGSGQAGCFLYCYDSFLSGLTSQVGQVSLISTNTYGTFTFKDAGSAAYLLVQGGNQFNAAWTINGGVYVEFSGGYSDTGYTIAGVTTGSGTPAIHSDSSSIPPVGSITGAYTLSFISQGNYVNANYTPTYYTAVSTDVTGNLQGIDNALGTLSPFMWNVETTSVALVSNNGYISNSGSLLTFTLPATAAVGNTFKIAGLGSGGWKVAQNASQLIYFGVDTTTTGTGGSLASTQSHDVIELVCVVANTSFIVTDSIGNITIV